MPQAPWAFVLITLACAAAAHPRVMTQLKPGMWVSALTHKHAPSIRTHAGQTTLPLGLGQYSLTVILNNITVDAVIDTGSGAAQIACENVTAPSTFNITRYDPSKAMPPVTLVNTTSKSCQLFKGQQIVSPPNEFCVYYTQYGGNDWVYAQVLDGVVSLPGSTLPAAPFSFGCAFQESTDPPLFVAWSALMGMDWTPPSLWSQLMAAKLVSDTMYLCMGNGGLGTKIGQNGVIILGSDSMVALPKGYATSVVTIKLLNPYTTPSTRDVPVNFTDSDNTTITVKTTVETLGLFPASMWVRLTGFSIGANPDRSFRGSARLTPAPWAVMTYLLDSGTSQLLLTTHEYAFWLSTFVDAISYSRHFRGANPISGGLVVVLDQVYTPSNLDSLMPPMIFNFQGSSGPVNILPSQYMLFTAYNTSVNATYFISIGTTNSATQGILGNAWMNGWLIQQTRSSLALKLTRVKSCDDIIY